MPVSPDLLEILACPACRTEVFLDTAGDEHIQCTNSQCRRRYAVRDDIPVMLIDESTVLDEAAFQTVMARRPVSSR